MKSKKTQLALLLLIFLTGMHFNLLAITAYPKPIVYSQPDGTKLTLTLRGDERIHWSETTDGYTILSNKDGAYVYAIKDKRGFLTFSDIIAHNPGNKTSTETAFLQNIDKNFKFSEQQIKEMRQSVLPVNRNAKGTMMGGFPTTGTRKMLMILANFSNTTTTIPQSSFNNYMNQSNYNGTGSFKDYYLEVSYGQLTVNSTVTIWVTLPNTHNYYGPDSKWGQFVYDAVVAANNQANVNYAEYDNDLDGYVDGIAVIHQGPGQEATGNTNDIWSHSWDLISAGYSTSQLTFDGVIVSNYTTQPELLGTSSSISTIGVMCHEFGHNLGAPDFYDTDYDTGGQYDGTGDWDIMSGGSWNGNSGDKPAHHNPWTKIFYQWSTPTVLTTAQNVTVLNNQTTNQIYKYNTTSSNEYFLAVNQQQTGFNSAIPGHGMIIYHVDGNYITNHMNANDINAGSHQGLYVKAANSTNGSGVSTNSNINTSGAPFPGTSNETSFTDLTTPNSKSWAGANTNLPLINISESAGNINFCFISCASPDDPTNFTAAAVSTSQINLTWGLNTNSNPVIVAYSTSPTFGTPVTGTTYNAGSTIAGGGTVIYNGSSTNYNHLSLNSNTTYYYKAWSILTGTTYSSGVTTNATTLCGSISTFPYSEGFENSGLIPNCWTQVNITGTLNYTFRAGSASGSPSSAHTGSYNANLYDGEGGTNNVTQLISPAFDISLLGTPTLTFWHYQKSWSGDQDELRVYYKTSPTGSWNLLNSYTSSVSSWTQRTIALPAASSTYYIAFEGTEKYGYGVCIDDISITGIVPALQVSPSNQNIAAAAGSTNFTVTTTNAWTAVSNQTWCTVTASGTGNGTITANCTENTSLTQRVASITVSQSGSTPVTVTVTQAGATPILSVSPSNQNVTTAAGSTSFTVTSNTAWTTLSNAAWCTVSAGSTGNGTITANFEANTTISSRTATITVSAGGVTPVTVTVTQAGTSATLTVTPSNQNVLAPAGTTSFQVTSNTTWTATSAQTWCTVTPNGSGNGTLTANFTENTSLDQRVASINVTNGTGTPITVTVTQAGATPSLLVTPSNIDVPATSGSTMYTVTSNTSWTVTSNQSWCMVTSSGNGNGNITANFQANPTTEARIASITVSANGVTPQVVTLTQEGADPILSVSPESIQVGHEAGATNFNVTSNINWTAQSSASWCSVTPSGSNSGSISVTYLENTNANARTATITVNGTGVAPVQVILIQEGTVGISATEGLTMNIMPIPAKDYLDIETAGFHEQMATLQIIDLTGHILATSSVIANGKTRFNLETLSGGIYFLRYSTNNQNITRRIVVVK